jgi:hypothetical protein
VVFKGAWIGRDRNLNAHTVVKCVDVIGDRVTLKSSVRACLGLPGWKDEFFCGPNATSLKRNRTCAATAAAFERTNLDEERASALERSFFPSRIGAGARIGSRWVRPAMSQMTPGGSAIQQRYADTEAALE